MVKPQNQLKFMSAPNVIDLLNHHWALQGLSRTVKDSGALNGAFASRPEIREAPKERMVKPQYQLGEYTTRLI